MSKYGLKNDHSSAQTYELFFFYSSILWPYREFCLSTSDSAPCYYEYEAAEDVHSVIILILGCYSFLQ